MSFCSELKTELSAIRPSNCCKTSLAYGFLLFSRSFSIKKISMQTENENTARLYTSLIEDIYGVEVTLKAAVGDKKYHTACVQDESDRLRVLASVDFGVYEGKINKEAFRRDCCAAAFIRGAFLACGHISDPNVSYRVDFPVKELRLAEEFKALLAEHYINANISTRGKGYVVYIKRSEMITNLLTVMGASARSLELIETTIIKSVKNNMNRARNCDSANISKTVEASIKQRTAIQYLKNRGLLGGLPEELQYAAELRLQNPDMTLKELCKKSSQPITASGLNHRFKKLIEIYNDCIKK